MQALRPYTRTFSKRKLDFAESKPVQVVPLLQTQKRFRKRDSGVSREVRVEELGNTPPLKDEELKTQSKCTFTYRRRSSRDISVKNVDHGLAACESGFRSPVAGNGECEELSEQDTRSISPSKAFPSCLQIVACSKDDSAGADIRSNQSLSECADTYSSGLKAVTCSLSASDLLDHSEINALSVPRVDTAILYEGPYPAYPRPLPEECAEVLRRLSSLHGPLEEYAHHKAERSSAKVLKLEYRKAEHEKDTLDGPVSTELLPKGRRIPRSVLDSLVATILSQNTTEANSRRAFASLKMKFPTWESVYNADPKAVEDAIRCGGLAEIKSTRILNILKTLHEERGKLCLEYVHQLSTDEIKYELSRFKGVGPKTIACVLMFHLQHNEFPVDTHVFRITKMLGWVPVQADREKAYLHLNHRIPDHLKFDLHCLLVTHGKRCPRCAKGGRAQRPADGPCPLVDLNSKCIETSQDVHYGKLEL
ncbi:hypothetical protein KP509_36G007900 [Ceratopteris richardii]|uniref:HhH-GPD domain-containing protein n=1 Tax=Ceratopteris richardii TaxID=49495 RepID=A0A8T2QAB3_CERRI|nr:hypothetical protein KP509_36G007900 [Ceratopteris richardii]